MAIPLLPPLAERTYRLNLQRISSESRSSFAASGVPDIRLELEQHLPMRKIRLTAHQDRISGTKL
jgi:hypothetical protein